MRVIALTAIRGGSEGIPNKGLLPICERPLMDWTLTQIREDQCVESSWVLSDSATVLEHATLAGAESLVEPEALATNTARIEDAWLYALSRIEKRTGPVDVVVAPQITSPLRLPLDFHKALDMFLLGNYDSLFSAVPAKDLCLWDMGDGKPTPALKECMNENRKRQNFPVRVIENGSIYIFRPDVLRQGYRFGGSIGIYQMLPWQVFELDDPEDIPLVTTLMRMYCLRCGPEPITKWEKENVPLCDLTLRHRFDILFHLFALTHKDDPAVIKAWGSLNKKQSFAQLEIVVQMVGEGTYPPIQVGYKHRDLYSVDGTKRIAASLFHRRSDITAWRCSNFNFCSRYNDDFSLTARCFPSLSKDMMSRFRAWCCVQNYIAGVVIND